MFIEKKSRVRITLLVIALFITQLTQRLHALHFFILLFESPSKIIKNGFYFISRSFCSEYIYISVTSFFPLSAIVEENYGNYNH